MRLAVILLASLLIGRFQSSSIAEPLGRLVAALDKMRQGDFTQRLNADRKDEFGVLGSGLNRLADDLSQLVGQVQSSGVQVNSSATQIATTAKQQQTTAHEIAATTAEIGATSKEISATSKELVRTMNEVNQVAEETASLAGSGQASIARMEATMRQIIEASGGVTAKLLACGCGPGGLVIVPGDGGTGRRLPSPYPTAGWAFPQWSADGRTVFHISEDSGRVFGVIAVPVDGRRPWVAIRFDDPARPWHRFGFRVAAGRVFFTLGDRQSDIWVADLGRK